MFHRFCQILISLTFLASPSTGWCETVVTTESNSRDQATPAFKFESIPTPSRTDAGNSATIQRRSGRLDRNSEPLVSLQDGLLPNEPDQPSRNVFFANDTSGEIVFDFGKEIDLKQINSYSWHPGSRAHQVYEVFVARSSTELTGETKSSEFDWKPIATVDTRKGNAQSGNQVGVSIRDSSGSFGSVRYVRLTIHPTQANRRFANTFFSEIDFIDGRDYPPASTPTPAQVIDVLDIDGTTKIRFDTTEMPELRTWVRNTLMPICNEWYPRIVAALPSENFEAPTDFSIIFERGMRGVAYTSGKDVHCAGAWYVENRDGEAAGSVVHELVHVVQQYPRRSNKRPSWLVEGIADQIRWFQYEPIEKRRKINFDRSNFDDAYFPSAAFLDYIVQNIDADVVSKMNAALRQGRYSDDLWQKWYAQTPQQIWQAMQD